LAALSLGIAAAPALADQPQSVVVIVDDDDDDGNFEPDLLQNKAIPPPDLVELPNLSAFSGKPIPSTDAVRFVHQGKPLAVGTPLPSRDVRLQALVPGQHVVTFASHPLHVRAIRIMALDGASKPVSFTSSHASFQRTPPDRIDDVTRPHGDPDALRFVLVGMKRDLPEHVRIDSRAQDGTLVDTLQRAKLVDVPCPPGTARELHCRSTWPVRVVSDPMDQSHPLVVDRSVRAVLGGGLVVRVGDLAQQIRVGGPRSTRYGPIQRLKGNLRITVPRTWPGGVPVLDSDSAAAMDMAREQFAGASAIWAQCGVTFGEPGPDTIRLLDPPPPFLLAIGCGLGLPASGGVVRFSIEDQSLQVPVPAGFSLEQAARRIAREIEAMGFRVTRSSNARIGPGALPEVDLMVFRQDGTPAHLASVQGEPLTTDPTLAVCVGRVDFAQGLRHFLDLDSMTGTVEERTLLKWFDDRDPRTLDAVFIPAFGRGGGRIGESFIGTDRSTLRNMVLVDRVGLSASNASHTLAHELGHVLLDVPGHPDDYGLDTPTLLMDSDAANASSFGPRRLRIEDCERMWQQSGPRAPVALLRPWPFQPLSK